MGWSWDEPLPDEEPPKDRPRRGVPQSRTEALGRRWMLVFIVLALIPLAPLVEWIYRTATYELDPRPLSWPLAPLGMLGTGCLLSVAAWRAQRTFWRIVLSFVEGALVLPRFILSLLGSVAAVPW